MKKALLVSGKIPEESLSLVGTKVNLVTTTYASTN